MEQMAFDENSAAAGVVVVADATVKEVEAGDSKEEEETRDDRGDPQFDELSRGANDDARPPHCENFQLESMLFLAAASSIT